MTHTDTNRRRPRRLVVALAAAAAVVATVATPQQADAGPPDPNDPRVGLAAGLDKPGTAALGMELLAHQNKPAGLTSTNSDIAFTGDHAIVGNYNGFAIYDVADPAHPTLRTAALCFGGQNDVSVYGDLLFVSVESTFARIDCATGGADATTRFRGIRIFDISDLDNPVQIGGVQTCRGSHTHTLVTGPDDASHVYLYNSGTAGVRSATEMAGCDSGPATNESPSRWLVEVIEVPLANPAAASIVNHARLFTDPDSGAYNGLQNTPTGTPHPSGPAYSPTPNTNHCTTSRPTPSSASPPGRAPVTAC